MKPGRTVYMILYLVRHGETDWNRRKMVMGREPVPLNENGIKGIARVARFLEDAGVEALFCGTLERTRQSAEILAGRWGLKVTTDQGLDESPFEKWVGKSFRELEPDPDFRLYMKKPTGSKFSLNEGIKDIQKRVVDSLERIASEPDIRVAAAVSHSDLIKPALVHWLGMDLDHMHRLTISNASVTRVDLRGGLPPKVRYINLVLPADWS
ncbi:MAG: hypothetical protein GF417_04630 [Candidatus Latescibacteria bacterium]|nr:hypothetical protein [bacterium]MBD3423708.1 hypothetical protein [Candidatus Latescibacterota bacterium]